MPQPLHALRLVELSGGIAAAYAGRMLRDGGAQVTLVEPAGGGPRRRRKAAAAMGLDAPLEDGETGALFGYLNRGKVGAMLPDGERTEAVIAACRSADVLVEDGGLEALGIDLPSLRAECPALSIVRISAWGAGGPLTDSPATEFTLQAETGALAARGFADRPPFATGGELGDYIAGSFAAVAALSAWRSSRIDGAGRLVDLSQFEAMLICLQPYQYIHGELQPGEPMPTSIDVPSVERASDGWIGYTTITHAQWCSFAEMIGHPELAEDESLRFGVQRFEQLDRVQPLITQYTRSHTIDELVAEATRRRIPVTPVGDAKTVMAMDQFVHREIFREVPEGHREPRRPWIMSGVDLPEPGEVPALERAPLPTVGKAAGGDPPGPMSDLRVLDLSAFWAGPMAGEIYAALGADVVKVEAVQRPDGMRYAGGFMPGGKPMWECSPIFLGANAGKRAITLDLTRPDGIDLMKRLVAQCDILIENFSPRVMEGFGLGWDEIHAINPRAIMLRMPAFGLDGPWRDRTGFAMTVEQTSGMAAQTGYPDRSPVTPRGCVDPIGGIDGALATMAALERRAETGVGELVEVALSEAGIAISAEPVIDEQVYGTHLGRAGNSGPGAVPQGIVTCANGEQVAVSVAGDEQWAALVDLVGARLGREEWRTAAGRRQDEGVIIESLSDWSASQSGDAVVAALLSAGVPAAPLRNVRTLSDHPQLAARGFFARLEHPVVGTIGFPGMPFRIDGEPVLPAIPAPMLGQHNAEILQGMLGLSAARIEELEADDIIGNRPVHA